MSISFFYEYLSAYKNGDVARLEYIRQQGFNLSFQQNSYFICFDNSIYSCILPANVAITNWVHAENAISKDLMRNFISSDNPLQFDSVKNAKLLIDAGFNMELLDDDWIWLIYSVEMMDLLLPYFKTLLNKSDGITILEAYDSLLRFKLIKNLRKKIGNELNRRSIFAILSIRKLPKELVKLLKTFN